MRNTRPNVENLQGWRFTLFECREICCPYQIYQILRSDEFLQRPNQHQAQCAATQKKTSESAFAQPMFQRGARKTQNRGKEHRSHEPRIPQHRGPPDEQRAVTVLQRYRMLPIPGHTACKASPCQFAQIVNGNHNAMVAITKCRLAAHHKVEGAVDFCLARCHSLQVLHREPIIGPAPLLDVLHSNHSTEHAQSISLRCTSPLPRAGSLSSLALCNCIVLLHGWVIVAIISGSIGCPAEASAGEILLAAKDGHCCWDCFANLVCPCCCQSKKDNGS